ncbi:Laccase-5 [Hibiscus syriacus]|uniref:Laccase n=1 Tax=Hibiscus syriacus TaxID=106335 RepID=A0A6A2Z5W2_HIBSY|nr:laccase-7-like [Hibiscus syriacus]KAE8686976.1 Laccase-5 [Hibiscus syriacus]
MGRLVFLFACSLLLLVAAASTPSAAIVEHTFHVQNLTLNRLCNRQVITAVNGSFPGPRIRVLEGDTLIVHVFNKSPYNLTIHWHGVFQILSGWADGPSMVTQCPIRPGNKYTYKFKIIKQEGTLWWHAHASALRATVYGALIIRPRTGNSYPFPKPYMEVPILLGEWWNANIVDIQNNALALGRGPNVSDAYTINGWPGDLYPCSTNQMYKLKVVRGKTYLLRIINAALDNQLFYKIANHKMTVVAVDACYTNRYVTDVVAIAPGQTVDVLLTADQPLGSYYMAARAYASAFGIVPFDNSTTRGVIVYDGAASSTTPVVPVLPAFNDTPTAHKFYSNLTSLAGGPHCDPVPVKVDHKMFVTIGLALEICPSNTTCQGPFNVTKLSAAMNNQSFVPPTGLSMLQAFFFNVGGVYTTDFPARPPVQFDYTNASINSNLSLLFAPKGTKTTKLKFNSTVEMVLQNTAILGAENHPMHLHGFDFHVLAQGFGNYNPATDTNKFNLFDPQRRNTIAVPVGGWAVIRFVANNPGVWFMHCHLDAHLPIGLATAFVVENGPTPATTLPPPPADLPLC